MTDPDTATNILDSSALLAPVALPALPAPPVASIPAADRAELNHVSLLISRVIAMQKATTMGMVIIGFHLRAIRDKHFPSKKSGGRPNAKHNQTGYTSFEDLCKIEFNISGTSYKRWINMAESVEQKMALTGDSLATCFEKLPWDWTAEESTLIEGAVAAITEGHTQKEILSWQCQTMIDLNLAGTPTIRDLHGTNNPSGKNGATTPKPHLTQEQYTAAQIQAARSYFYGTPDPGKCAPESLCFSLMEAAKPGSLLQYLPAAEREFFADHVLKPLLSLIRSLP